MTALLEGSKIIKQFGGLKALDNLDIRVESGEILGLIGPNGSGKTTLLNVTTGFLKPEMGEITFKGESVTGLEPHKIAARGIIRTFQHAHCLMELTSKENVISGRFLKANDSLLESIIKNRKYREKKKRLSEDAEEILRFLGMEERREVLAGNLSPGEQRKLEIGIALSAEPQLLMLDEPAGGLNSEECLELIGIVRSIREKGTTVIIVEHNMKVVMNLCTRIIVIDSGRKVAEGSPEEIAESDKVISIYLGRDVHAKRR